MKIQYPKYHYKIERTEKADRIFDPIRKKWLQLTPEEWVRQNFVQYLLQVCKYPETLVAIEKELYLGDLKKRFDILVYDRAMKPWLLVECKAMHVSLSESVLQQALRYNISLPVPYIIITNGNQTLGWQKGEGQLIPLEEMPFMPLTSF